MTIVNENIVPINGLVDFEQEDQCGSFSTRVAVI